MGRKKNLGPEAEAEQGGSQQASPRCHQQTSAGSRCCEPSYLVLSQEQHTMNGDRFLKLLCMLSRILENQLKLAEETLTLAERRLRIWA